VLKLDRPSVEQLVGQEVSITSVPDVPAYDGYGG